MGERIERRYWGDEIITKINNIFEDCQYALINFTFKSQNDHLQVLSFKMYYNIVSSKSSSLTLRNATGNSDFGQLILVEILSFDVSHWWTFTEVYCSALVKGTRKQSLIWSAFSKAKPYKMLAIQ